MARYELIAQSTGQRIAFDLEVGGPREAVLGRHPEADLTLDDERASRRHCVVALTEDGKLIVRDLRSQNGTRVNGHRVSQASLGDGDTITVGRTQLVVRVDHGHAPEAAAERSPAAASDASQPKPRKGLRARHAEANGHVASAAEPVGPSGSASARAPVDEVETIDTDVRFDDDEMAARIAGLSGPMFDDLDEDLLRPIPPSKAHPVDRAPAAARSGSGGDGEWAKRLEKITLSLPPSSDELPIVLLINADGRPSAAFEGEGPGSVATRLILMCAGKARATDIHVEPREDLVTVRMRIDGAMVHIVDLPLEVGGMTMRLIKTACQFKHGKRDSVLDGHFSARYDGRRIDYRASFTPTVHGSKLVVRLLDGSNAPSRLADLNLPAFMHERVRRVCEQDTGLLLVAGPTGSGKTTTLYNALREIDRERRNVITIEDPVEYYVDGVTQIPVAEDTSFGQLLRSVLRQDPDVILVGEIRDQETARTAMQAAMTGHVVFSTVHAKDTIGSVFRLIDLGVENYLVASSLDIVLAQRLVRVLCESCKREVPVSPGQATRVGRYLGGRSTVYTATGCARCLRTGYFGRHGIYEMLDFKNNDALRDLILTTPSIQGMKKVIEQGVFQTLQQAGWTLAAKGVTSLEEIERVTG